MARTYGSYQKWSEKYCGVDEVYPGELADVEIMRGEVEWIFDQDEEDVVHGYGSGQPERFRGRALRVGSTMPGCWPGKRLVLVCDLAEVDPLLWSANYRVLGSCVGFH
jgi:hypothetical protein